MARRDADKPSPMDRVRASHPRVREALVADARVAAANRGEAHELSSPGAAALYIAKLMWSSDAFLAQALYRCKARLQALGVPILPRVAHRLAMTTGQVSIGDPVIVHPGIYTLHGQVVIDGFVEVEQGAVIGPFVTIGLRAGDFVGPSIGKDVSIGTGAKLLGRIRIGDGARIAANAVVIEDVPARTTVAGAPARPLPERSKADA